MLATGWYKTSKRLIDTLKNFKFQVKMISIGDGRCSAQFKVADEHLNRYGVLHGGFTASLIETVTSEALLARPNCPFGVSVEMHVTFMKGARPGDEVLIDASPVRSGKNFAFMECELRHKRDNAHGVLSGDEDVSWGRFFPVICVDYGGVFEKRVKVFN